MQWLMLQQDSPEDFVIATGKQYSVRQFIQWSAQYLGFELGFENEGVQEIGRVTKVLDATQAPRIKAGDVVVRVDPRYFRPTEVETLLGDPSKAKQKLGWAPEITTEQMCAEMCEEDLRQAKKQALLRAHGFNDSVPTE
jgi:GDPmannose 4,6-dehydratase